MAEKILDHFQQAIPFRRGEVRLDPIAGGNDATLPYDVCLFEIAQPLAQASPADGQLLPDFNWRRAMI